MRSPIKLRSVARHGDMLPEEIPAAASARTETFGAVTVAPSTFEASLTRVREAMARYDDLGDTRAFKAYEFPAPPPLFTSQARFDRGVLADLRRDYAELPIFRSVIPDRWELHRLAVRAPHNVYGGSHE